METVTFTFEVPKCCVDILEQAECCSAEEMLDKHLAEWWFGKTHHEADMITNGRHCKIPQTAESLDMADGVKKCMCADQHEYSPKELGISEKTAKQIEELREVAKFKPKPPKPHGQMGKKELFENEKWFMDMVEKEAKRLESRAELKAISPDSVPEEETPTFDQFMAKKIKEMEKSEEFKQYKKDYAKWETAVTYLADLDRGFPKERWAMAESRKYKPSVARV